MPPSANAGTRSQVNAIDRLANFAGWTKVLLPQRRLRRLYASSQTLPAPNVFESMLRALEVAYEASERDLGLIPNAGASIVVANHPFGMLDGMLLGALLLRIRNDVKIVANRLLAGIPELAPHCIYVDAMDGEDKPAVNARGLRHAIRHLRSGGLIVLFPAGEVAHWSVRTMSIRDPRWNDSAARLSQMTGAPVTPICIHGANSFAFHATGMIHPKLRTLQLPRELLNKRGQRVEIAVGPPVTAAKLNAAGGARTATSMLRWNADMLFLRAANGRSPSRWQFPMPSTVSAIGPETDVALIVRELRVLPADARLQHQGEFEVYQVTAAQAPNVLREIGRLREISFRLAGEGTGNASDLDRFDEHYTHLVLWHRERRQIAGAYRLGNVRPILQRWGLSGLYTSSLFRYRPSFFTSIDGALELGRSFVRPEYQKHYTPLLLLWKGIGAYLVRHPETPVLFGAVSVSNHYSPASREVIATFLGAQMAHESLVAKVSPRSSFRHAACSGLSSDQSFCRTLTLGDVSERVASWEADGKDLPILVKHYLKLGGKTLAFSVDKKFSGVLDALIMVDLRASDPALLSRYLGRAEAQMFLSRVTTPRGVTNGPTVSAR